MSKEDQIRWNKKYLDRVSGNGDLQPSGWLSQHRDLIIAGPKTKALDLACGLGRNSIFLANLGFEVYSWDISNVAIDYLRQQKDHYKLNIHPEVIDLDNIGRVRNKFQIILNFNFLDRKLFSFIKEALLPGGLLFFETYSQIQGDPENSVVPSKYHLKEAELIEEFSDFKMISYRETSSKCKTKASLLAMKPNSN